MSGTHGVQVGDKGRIVLPAAIREHRRWVTGTPLIAIETSSGVLLAQREEVERIVASQLAGKDLISGLLDERREAARIEDA